MKNKYHRKQERTVRKSVNFRAREISGFKSTFDYLIAVDFGQITYSKPELSHLYNLLWIKQNVWFGETNQW